MSSLANSSKGVWRTVTCFHQSHLLRMFSQGLKSKSTKTRIRVGAKPYLIIVTINIHPEKHELMGEGGGSIRLVNKYFQ